MHLASRSRAANSRELATVKARYKAPDRDVSRLLSTVVRNLDAPMGRNLGFASAVAEFGMRLRDSEDKRSASYRAAAERARRFAG